MTETEKDEVSKTVASLSECISLALDDIKKLEMAKQIAEEELASLALDYCKAIYERDKLAERNRALQTETVVLLIICLISTGVLLSAAIFGL